MTESFDSPPDEPPPPPGTTRQLPRFDSRDLMRGGREALIHHNGEWYRLCVTRNDKLILHK